MYRSFLLLVTCVATAFAQTPAPPPNAPEIVNKQGPGNRRVQANLLDDATWTSKLAEVTPEERRFFRTWRMGIVLDSARIDYGGDGAVLKGIELNFEKNSKMQRVNSLRGVYQLSGRNKVLGATLGNSKGELVRLNAKEGYAVSGIVFNQQDSGIAGISVRFARLLPDGTLNLRDSYSENAGSGGGTILEAEPLPFCGIYVTPGEPGAPLDGVALLVSQKLVREKAPTLAPQSKTNRGPLGILPGMPQPDVVRENRSILVIREEVELVPNAAVNELIKNYSNRLFFIEGAAGKGTSFTCRLNNKTFLLTNQHVVAGNKQIQFAGLDRNRLAVGEAKAAVGHDVFSFAVGDDTPSLELLPDVAKNVSTGDVVIVLGNTEGAGVVRPILGRVVGIGPNLIEVSAKFLPGNSGSPIIHLKTGKVIGIASYATVKPFNQNGFPGMQQPEIRRYGYRIDSITNWQPVNWPQYHAEANAIDECAAFTDLFAKTYDCLFGTAGVNNAPKTDPRLHAAFAVFPMSSSISVNPDSVRNNFIRELGNASKVDIASLRPKLRYDFFQRRLAEEETLRSQIVSAFEEKKQSIYVATPPVAIPPHVAPPKPKGFRQ